MSTLSPTDMHVVVVVVVVVVVRTLCLYDVSVHPTQQSCNELDGKSPGSQTPGDPAAPMAGVNPDPVPVHRAAPIEQAEHLHDFHDLWHDATISSTPREQELRDIAVFCTLNYEASVVAHNRRVNDLVQARVRRVENCGIAAVFSTAATEDLQGHMIGTSATVSTNWGITMVF